jgi:ATP-dependent Clp protease ATP-binding subunit ClpC
MMLQILEDGHLTDAKGRKVNFKNTVIIMTSNIGSEMIMEMGRRGEFGFSDGKKASVQKQEENMKEKVMDALKDHFKPEFLNRIDEIIVFHPLDQKQIRHIVDLQIELVAKRLSEQKIILEVNDKAKDWLGKKGYDANLGARPLKRVIQTELLDPLSMLIIEGKIKDGHTVNVTVEKESLALKV